MALLEALNKDKVKPIVTGPGKIGLYYVGGAPFSMERSKEIEDKFGIVDLYVSQNPLSQEMNNFVVWAYTDSETVFFNKTEQKWALV